MRNPFITGRWVVKEDFFGRKELILQLLNSHEICDWVMGMRRMGKTSLLREIQERTPSHEPDQFPVFWDIQGSFNEEGLQESFIDALEDSLDLAPAPPDLDLASIEEGRGIHQIIRKLVRQLSAHKKKLLLLIDEAEELITVNQNDPDCLGKLRKAIQASGKIHTILCSTPRLERLNESRSHTSPFLHGFHHRYLGNFQSQEVRGLLQRGQIPDLEIEETITICDGNPYQTQLFGKILFEGKASGEVFQELNANPSLAQVHDVNFELISENAKRLLKEIQGGKSNLSQYPQGEKNTIRQLEQLGFLVLYSDEVIHISSRFFRNWLHAKFEAMPSIHSEQAEDQEIGLAEGAMIGHLPTLFRILLEFRKNQKLLDLELTTWAISQLDSTLYVKTPVTQEVRVEIPEQEAFNDLKSILDTFHKNVESWPLQRFLQIADRGEHQDLVQLLEMTAQEHILG